MAEVQTRDPETLQRRIAERRDDLVASMSELGDVVRDKLDVRAQARRAVQRGKVRAEEAYSRSKAMANQAYYAGKERAGQAYYASKRTVVAHPYSFIALTGGFLTLLTMGLVWRRQKRMQAKLLGYC